MHTALRNKLQRAKGCVINVTHSIYELRWNDQHRCYDIRMLLFPLMGEVNPVSKNKITLLKLQILSLVQKNSQH